MTLHTFSIYVTDQPGVLNRVASLFRRRGFNIHSLAVGESERAGISRMTALVETDAAGARRVAAHLYKLVDVVQVDDITDAGAVARELALVKVRAAQDVRPGLLQLAHVFQARVVDVGPSSLIVEIAGAESKIDNLIEVLRPYGLLEVVRTGRVAMPRGSAARDRDATERIDAEPGEQIACSV